MENACFFQLQKNVCCVQEKNYFIKELLNIEVLCLTRKMINAEWLRTEVLQPDI